MVDVKTEREQLRGLEELFAQKRFSDALNIAKKLKDQYPNSFQIRFTYVRVLRELNKLGEAEEELAQLMQTFPNNINLLMEMGKLATERNKFDEGIEFYNKILFLDPFNTEAKDSIDKLNDLKRSGVQADSGNLGFASYTGEKLHRADTLPEVDTEGLKAAMNTEITPDDQIEADTRPMTTLTPDSAPVSDQGPEPEPEPQFQSPPPPPPEAIPEPLSEPEPVPVVELPEQPFHQPLEIPDLPDSEQATPPPPPISFADIQEETPFQTPPPPPPEPEPVFDIPGIEEADAVSDFQSEPAPPITTGDVPEEEQETTPGHLPEPESSLSFDDIREDGEPSDPEPMEPAPEPLQQSQAAEPENTGDGFMTESAAELYLKQGLWKDALDIYKNLYQTQKEERFLVKINHLKKQLITRKQIALLTEFLAVVKRRIPYEGEGD